MALPEELVKVLLRLSPEGALLGLRTQDNVVASVPASGTHNFTFTPESSNYAAVIYQLDFVNVLPRFFELDVMAKGNNIYSGLMDAVTTAQGLHFVEWVTAGQVMSIQIRNTDTKRAHYWQHIVRYGTVSNQRYFDLIHALLRGQDITPTAGRSR